MSRGPLIWISPTPVWGRSTTLDLRMEPNGSGPDTGCRCLSPRNPMASYWGTSAPLVGSGEGRCKFGMENPTYPGLTQRRPSTGIQQVQPTPDQFTFGSPTPVLLSTDKQFPGAGTRSEFYQVRGGGGDCLT